MSNFFYRHHREALVATCAFLLVAASLSVSQSAYAQPTVQSTLERYYIHYKYPGLPYPPGDGSGSDLVNSTFTDSPPLIDKWIVTSAGDPPAFYPVNSRVAMTTRLSPQSIEFFYDAAYSPMCPNAPLLIDRNVTAAATFNYQSAWFIATPWGCGLYLDLGPLLPGESKWVFTDTVTFGAPVRRKALDGSQYDASSMRILRNGTPWLSYHWGYRLGLVATTSQWDPANLPFVPALVNWPQFPDRAKDFELTAQPPPWIEDDVVEYVNRADFPNQPGGQYFYAVRAEDKTLLDSIAAWQRTGKGFKSGGYVSACRFYGGKNGGPNTHFYSADDKECAALKAIPQLSYEGQTFAVNVPLPGAATNGIRPCPVASKALFRVYNNASASSGRFASNHRYLTEKADVAAVVAQGWVDEGQVMCVPT